MINIFISAILQVLVFALIPLVVYLIKARSVKGFFNYVGLKPSTLRANLLGLLCTLLLALPLVILTLFNQEFKAIMTAPGSVTGTIRQLGGVEAILTIAVIALVKTALSEEILFRGFIAKRLIALTSFRTGNLLQAVLFGLLHTVLFTMITHHVLFLVIIFVFPTLGAFVNAYINEKLARGSIIPGWIAHGTANIVAYTTVFLAP